VVWDEGKLPELIIELLSDSTAANDRGLKKDIDKLRELGIDPNNI